MSSGYNHWTSSFGRNFGDNFFDFINISRYTFWAARDRTACMMSNFQSEYAPFITGSYSEEFPSPMIKSEIESEYMFSLSGPTWGVSGGEEDMITQMDWVIRTSLPANHDSFNSVIAREHVTYDAEGNVDTVWWDAHPL